MRFLFLLLALFSLTANADFISKNVEPTKIYYVTVGGNDTTGNGSASKPWLTLAKACTAVTATNSIIYVRNGTHNETVICSQAVGVSIQCESNTLSIIKPVSGFPTGTEDALIKAHSTTEGVFGNQSVSNCKLDGNSRLGKSAITMKGRSNYSVLNNTIVDFDDHGVDFHGEGSSNSTASINVVWGTGNKFNYNTITNSALFSGYGRGLFQVGLQDGLEVIGNTMTQTGRTAGSNGWCMKYLQSNQMAGGLRKSKILYNTCDKQGDVGDAFRFNFEFYNVGDETEIAYNKLSGATDINNTFLTRGNTYSLDFHDNVVGPATFNSTCLAGTYYCLDEGVDLEYSTSHVWVRNNTFKNMAYVMDYQFHNGGQSIHDIRVENNIGYNVCSGNKSNSSGTNEMYNISYIGNTFISNTSAALCDLANGYGIYFAAPLGYNRNYTAINNIISGFGGAPVFTYGGPVDGMHINSNLYYNNGHSNTTWINGNVVTNLLELNTVSSDPLFNNGTGNTVTAGSFTATKKYTIKTIGTTNFTSIGATSNTVGLQFAATGVGTGTGTAEEADFTLQSGSPAKTTCLIGQTVTDKNYKNRNGATCSIGAFEY